jgi:uncharacterized membrane protein
MNRWSIEEAVSYGWKSMTTRVWFWIVFLLVLFLLFAVAQRIEHFLLPDGLEHIADWVLQILCWMVLLWAGLRVHDDLPPQWDRIFSSWRRVGNLVVAQLLYWLIIAGGVLLLVVPGLIWAAQYHYAAFLVLDEDLGPIEALKRSARLTRGSRTNLIMFGLVAFGINVLGALALVIGLFAAIPTTILADVWIFRRLQAADAATLAPLPPVAAQS